MVDEQFKQQVDAYVDEVWEDVVADIARLVRHESVEDLSAASPGDRHPGTPSTRPSGWPSAWASP